MATYNPNLDFLKEQLTSIERQTYRNLDLIILDDFSSSENYNAIRKVSQEILVETPFTVEQNETNLGSNNTFEKLIERANSDYIGLCDQDDIFTTDKYEKLIELIEKEKGVLAYSDAKVIDSHGNTIHKSFKSYARRVTHLYGENAGCKFIRRNSVTGCTMLIRSDIAKAALPFPKYQYYVHDHWLALVAANLGRILYSETPLVSYRLHGKNQIGASSLTNVVNKDSYLQNKLQVEKEKYKEVVSRSEMFSPDVKNEAEEYIRNVDARIDFYENTNIKTLLQVVKTRKIDMELLAFELVLAVSPSFLQNRIIAKLKRV